MQTHQPRIIPHHGELAAEIAELIRRKYAEVGDGLIVAISGGSCSGKSTLMKNLSTLLIDLPFVAMPLDQYYLDCDDPRMPRNADGSPCYDVPDSFDIGQYLSHVSDFVNGRLFEIPNYCQRLGKRRNRVTPADGIRKIMISEGLFPISLINWYCDRFNYGKDKVLNIYLKSNLPLARQRRLQRDPVELGETVEYVEKMFDGQVVPCFHQHVKPQKEAAHIIVMAPVE